MFFQAGRDSPAEPPERRHPGRRTAIRTALTTAGPKVTRLHTNYHIPISNTATAAMVLDVG